MSELGTMSGVKTPLREVRLRVGFCCALIMLSIDAVNPVKVVCSILGIDTSYLAVLSIIAFFGILYSNAKDLAYFSVKVFMHSIFTIFFSSMEVLGKKNIPEHGPVIFVGNHMNQFVDGAVMLVTNPHRVGFLVAEKSYNKRVIGDFAKAVGSIPVSRPQDNAKRGPGKIKFEGVKMIGEGTKFTELTNKDKILPGRSPEIYRIESIISDTEAVIVEDPSEASVEVAACQGKFTEYDILGFVDQGKMFEAVQVALSKGRSIGIFPEGGSHDQTDLLPLKVGVAAIAYGVLEKFDVSVPIVPVGLNYFRGHRFRGRVVVEFGEPIHITKEMHQVYKESKRTAYQGLLTQIEEGLRAVIVTATDYPELKLVYTARRLYQRSESKMSTAIRQDLARRFAAAYKIIKDKHNGELPEDLKLLQTKIENYQDQLDHWGLKDYQINMLEIEYSQMLYSFVHGLVILVLASIPSLVLNAPVGLAAHYWAEKEAAKDLKASRVKVAARDVLLSKKILFSICAVPVLWVTYAVLFVLFSNLQKRTIFVFFLCCPLFSYLGVMAVEKGMMDIKDLRPAFLRLLPGFRKQAEKLPILRASLQKELRAAVKKYGPEMGSLYYDKTGEWEKSIIKKSM